MIKCCKDCEDRSVGCHGKCERYLAEKERAGRITEARNKESYVNYLVKSCNYGRKGV